jgi:holo-[acyl-carrier protein] synthase
LGSKRSLLSSPAFFSAEERSYCHQKHEPLASFAGLLCAKEAFIKAVKGISQFPPFSFSDFELSHLPNGRPVIVLHGILADWCRARDVETDVSISHSGDYAAAMVLVYVKGCVHDV